jgi:hypothetical protein
MKRHRWPVERSSGTPHALPSGGEELVVAHLAGERRKQRLPGAMHPTSWWSSGQVPGLHRSRMESGRRQAAFTPARRAR